MTVIDNRVVEMQFDDSDFTPGIKTAIDSLDKLQQALKLDAPAKGFAAITSTAMSVSGEMNGLQYTVSKVSNSFSAMELAAITAFTNIVNRAVNAGVRIAKSLSIDQVTQGFGEYELKMGSIQTIMAGTGEPLEKVNALLDELNHYADKTIYSFSDMTANIGKFTNAGVKLETAVAAIQGVSNLAALSGANANEASRAMYNFAQALSAGYVKLIDWKSIENANMATVEFKNELIKTALSLGTVVREGNMYVSTTTDMQGKVSAAFDATRNFNDSLSAQWMTTDVLTTTLSRYVDETTEVGKKASTAATELKTFTMLMDALKESIGSGWANTFELIFGDFHEAKDLWTGLGHALEEVIGPIGDFRNSMLQVWRDMGGREKILDAIAKNFEFVGKVVEPIQRAMSDAFDLPGVGERLGAWSAWVQNLADARSRIVVDSDKIYGAFTKIFEAFDSAGSGVGEFFGHLTRGTRTVFRNTDFAGIADSIGDFLTTLSDAFSLSRMDAIDLASAFTHAFAGIRDVLLGFGNIVKFVGELFAPIVKAFRESVGFSHFGKSVESLAGSFLHLTSMLKVTEEQSSAIESVFKVIFSVVDLVAKGITALASILGKVFDGVGSVVLHALYPVFQSIAVVIGWVADKVNALIGYFTDLGDDGKTAFQRLVASNPALRVLSQILGGLITIVAGVAKGARDLFLSIDWDGLLGGIADWARRASEAIGGWLEKLKDTAAVQALAGWLDKARGYASNFMDAVRDVGPLEALKRVANDVADAFERLKTEQTLAGAAARGIQSAIDAVTGVIDKIKKKLDEIKELFDELGITEGFDKMVKGVLNLDSDLFAEGFQQAGDGVYRLMIDHVLPSVSRGLTAIKDEVNRFFESDALPSFLETVKSFFSFDKLKESFSSIGQAFTNTSLFQGFTTGISGFLDGLLGVFGIKFEDFQDAFDTLTYFASGFTDPIGRLVSTIGDKMADAGSSLATIFGDTFTSFLEKLAPDMIENPDLALQKVLGILKSGTLLAILANINGILSSAKRVLDSIRGTIASVSRTFKGLGRMFSGIGHAFTGLAILEFAASILVIANALKIIADIPEEDLGRAVAVVGGIAAVLGILMALMTKLSGDTSVSIEGDGPIKQIKDVLSGFASGLKGLNVAAVGLSVLAFSVALMLIVRTIKTVADLLNEYSLEDLAKGFGVVFGIIAIFIAGIKAMSNVGNGGSMFGAALSILAMAAAMRLIIGAVGSVMELSKDSQFDTAIGVIGGLLAGMALAISTIATASSGLGGFGQMAGVALAFLALGYSLQLIVDAVRSLSEASAETDISTAFWMIEGLMATLAACISAVALAANDLTGFGELLGAAIAFVAIAFALKIVVEAISDLANVAEEHDIGAAVLTITGMLLGLSLAVAAFGIIGGILPTAAIGMLAGAAAMWIISDAVRKIAEALDSLLSIEFDPAKLEDVASAMERLVGDIGLLVVAFGIIGGILPTAAIGMLAGAAAMWIISDATEKLCSALSGIAEIDPDGLTRALDTLTGIFVALLITSGIAAACPAFELAMGILAGALWLIGDAVESAGNGLKDISDALTQLTLIESGSFDGLAESIKSFIEAFDLLDAAKIATVTANLGPLMDALERLSDVFVSLKDSGVYSSEAAIGRLLDSLQNYAGAPNLQDFIIFLDALEAHHEAFKTFGDSAWKVNSGLDVMSSSVEKLAGASESFSGSADAFVQDLSDVGTAITDFVTVSDGLSGAADNVSSAVRDLVDAMAQAANMDASKMAQAGEALVDQLASGVSGHHGPALNAVNSLVRAAYQAAQSGANLSGFRSAAMAMANSLVSGLSAYAGRAWSAGYSLGRSAYSGASSVASSFYSIGSYMGQGMVSGLLSSGVVARVYSAAYRMASAAKNAANDAVKVASPSKVFIEIGKFCGMGLAIGLERSSGLAETASRNMARSVSMIAQSAIDDINNAKYSLRLQPIVDDTALNGLSAGFAPNFGGSIHATLGDIDQNGRNSAFVDEFRRLRKDVTELAAQPRTEVHIGDINATDNAEIVTATRDYITKLALLKGGM